VDTLTINTRGGGKELEEKLERIGKKLESIVNKHYPHPIPAMRIRVPFSRDEVAVVLDEPVKLDFLFYPIGYIFVGDPTINLYRRSGKPIGAVLLDFRNESIYSAILLNPNGEPIYVDRYGSAALTYLLLPEIFAKLRNARIFSHRRGPGVKWVSRFIESAEQVSESGVLNAVSQRDLLDSEGVMNTFTVRFYGLDEHLKEMEITISFVDKLIRTYLSFGSSGYAFISLMRTENSTERLRVAAASEDVKRKAEKYLAVFRESMLDDAANCIAKFIDAYKVFRLTLAYMDL